MDENKFNERMFNLLSSLISGGYRDYMKLNDVVAIAELFEISTDDISDMFNELTENAKGINLYDDGLNYLLYSTMELIRQRVIEEMRDQDTKEEVISKMEDVEFFVNYLDTHFNIDALDELDSDDIERLIQKYGRDKAKDIVVKSVIADLTA